MNDHPLARSFYARNVQVVARELLGKKLVSSLHGQRVSGFIYEAEAYDGEQDQACHARAGKTTRNAAMYGESGHAYVYFTYGMHWMLNCVAGQMGYPAAVLIRAIYPAEGTEIIQSVRTPIKEKYWCDGPAKLTKSLGITGDQNHADLCDPSSPIIIEDGITIKDEWVTITARIGIDNTPEPWKSKPWRYRANLSAFI